MMPPDGSSLKLPSGPQPPGPPRCSPGIRAEAGFHGSPSKSLTRRNCVRKYRESCSNLLSPRVARYPVIWEPTPSASTPRPCWAPRSALPVAAFGLNAAPPSLDPSLVAGATASPGTRGGDRVFKQVLSCFPQKRALRFQGWTMQKNPQLSLLLLPLPPVLLCWTQPHLSLVVTFLSHLHKQQVGRREL